MRVLITSAVSASAHRLKTKFDKNNVLLGDYHDLPDFMLQKGDMIKLPNPQSTSYQHEMLTLCLDNHVDIIYVLDNKEAELLQESKQLFNEYNIEIQITSDAVQ